MRTCNVTLYKYNELDERAQERARDAARNAGWFGDAWEGEWRDSLDKAQHALPFRVVDWSVGLGSHSFARVSVEDDVAELAGARAWKYLQNNGIAEAIGEDGACPFTGYCGDESLLDPLRAFLLRPHPRTTLGELFQDCADSWVRAWLADMEYQLSDEYVAEHLEVNEYEYTEDGERH